MSLTRFRKLSSHHRSLVATAVLLDGVEAGQYISLDSEHGASLRQACEDLLKCDVEVRLALAATELRSALDESVKKGVA